MSAQYATTLERSQRGNGQSRIGVIYECERKEIADSGQRSAGVQNGSNALKQPMRKISSSSSLYSSPKKAGGNVPLGTQDDGSIKTSSMVSKHLKENEKIERNNGRHTIGHGVESPFRERLPSFSIRQTNKLQTHFAVYKFVPRHTDELAINIGDAIHVGKVHDDLWYEGTNLRSGERGIFPGRYVSNILSNTGSSFEFSEYGVQFFLRFLGSVEVFEFKGNNVLCQAVAKILQVRKSGRLSEIPPCSLEVDHRGIRLTDHTQEIEKRQSKSLVGRFFNNEQKVPEAKYFFKLKDVTFCGCYPNSPRYFGFVTKHPTEHRFACHTFMSEYSTEPVAKAIGQAFRRFYADYMERRPSS